MVAYLIIPRLYLAAGSGTQHEFQQWLLEFISLFSTEIVRPLSLYPSRVLLSTLSLSFSEASFFFDFLLRLDTWKVFHSPIRTDSSIIRFVTFLRNSCPKFPTYFTYFIFDILDIHARVESIANFFEIGGEKTSNVFPIHDWRGGGELMHPFRTGKDRVNVIVLPGLRLITANCHPFKWKTFGGAIHAT